MLGLTTVACESGRAPDAGASGGSTRTLRVAFARIERADLELVQKQVARFARAHPGWRVEVVPQVWRSTDIHDLFARFLALGDPGLDVYIIDDPWIAEFAFAGWIRPLPELETWARAELHPAGLRSAIFRDQLFAVPLELSANALFYRRDLLERAGLKPPRSLEELLEQAARLKAEQGLAQGLVLHASYLHNDIYPFLWASGGEVLSPKERIGLNSPRNLEVIGRLAAAFAQGQAVPSREEMRHFSDSGRHAYHDAVADFTQGRAAFMVNWLRTAAASADPRSPLHGRLGITAIPGLGGRGFGATVGSWHLAVNAASREPAMARALIRYLTSPEAVWERYEQLATLPPLKHFYTDPERLRAHPALATAEQVLTHARNRMPLPNERALNEIAEQALHDVLFKGLAPAPTLAKARQSMQAEVDSLPRKALSFPPLEAEPRSPSIIASDHLLLALSLLWVVAILLGVTYFVVDRRRGLFRALSLRFATLGFSITLLAVVTGVVGALVILIRSQETSIREAQDIFRRAIVEHSRSMGRQIALGASLVRDAVDAVPRAVKAGQRVTYEEGTLDSIYVLSLDMLTAEGRYSDDIIFLQVLRADGRVVSTERDFLDRQLVHGRAAGRPTTDPELRRMVRFCRSLTVRDVPAGKFPSHVEVLMPLYERGRHAGAVHIGYSKQRQAARIQALRQRQAHQLRRGVVLVAGLAGGLVLLGAVLLLLLARGVSVPLVKLQGLAERIGHGDLTVRCAIPGRDEVASLGVHMNKMVEGLLEREQIRETFGRFLGPGVSEHLLSGEVALGGEERLVTVLFSDLRGFTTISERLTPEKVVRLLNVYFDHMVDAVFAHGGMLDKFMGDGLMAVFGAPQPDSEHALKAVRAALDMRARLVTVNAALAAEGLPELQLGVGLHTGPAVLGNIGSTKRMEYTAIGDTVNLASRLEGVTKQFGVDIAMSAATHAVVGDRVRSARLGELAVKGKSIETEVYSVEALTDAAPMESPPPQG